jgi:hypothetical protein
MGRRRYNHGSVSAPPPSDGNIFLNRPEPGTLFGNYRLLSPLGRGGFASVFRAELRGEFGFSKQVALKILRRRVDSLDEREVTGFLNEARLGAYLSHANLVEFYECGRVDDLLYIAMELVDGPNLSQIMRMIPGHLDALEADVISTIAVQTARGLRALHEATMEDRRLGAIHRDMKPANILLAPQGQAKITDYGITQVAADFYQTMASGTVRGSPLYMSPEQARGEELTQSSDVFSYGLVLLEMITGDPVFVAPTLEAIVERVRHADVGPSLAAGRDRMPELMPLVEGCLVPDPASRITHGKALVEALKSVKPPSFGDERVAQLVRDANVVLAEYRERRRAEPVRRFWSRLPDGPGADGGNLGDLATLGGAGQEQREDHDSQAARPVPSATPRGDSPAGPRRRNRKLFLTIHRQRAWWLWPAAAVVGLGLGTLLVVLITALVHWIRPGDDPAAAPEPDTVAVIVEADGGAAEGAADRHGTRDLITIGDEEPDDADVNDDAGEEVTPERVPEPGEREPSRGSQRGVPSPLRLDHDGPARAIRGDDVSLTVGVSPLGSYPASVWYRCAPGGDWNRRSHQGGDGGQLRLTIPAGDWQVAGCGQVDYFVEIEGADGLVRKGSTVRPLSYRLY